MEDKPKFLPPNLRERVRYLAFKVFSEQPISFEDLSKAIWFSFMNFLGEFGTSKAGVWIVKNLYNSKEQIGLLSCNHTSVEEIRMCLSLIQKVGETRVTIKSLGVTGTIEAAKRKYLGVRTLEEFGD